MQPKKALEVEELIAPATDALAVASTEPWVGECIDAKHPTLCGRVLVRFTVPSGDTTERWMPLLHGLSARQGDRLLFLKPANWSEAIVVGVVDGFARRPEAPRGTKAAVALKPDEALRVESDDGAPLVEVFQGERGPVIRLLESDADIELAGRLRLSAKSLELVAREGEARIFASDDVVVRGETIHLN